jgi:hypothetical protein
MDKIEKELEILNKLPVSIRVKMFFEEFLNKKRNIVFSKRYIMKKLKLNNDYYLKDYLTNYKYQNKKIHFGNAYVIYGHPKDIEKLKRMVKSE